MQEVKPLPWPPDFKIPALPDEDQATAKQLVEAAVAFLEESPELDPMIQLQPVEGEIPGHPNPDLRLMAVLTNADGKKLFDHLRNLFAPENLNLYLLAGTMRDATLIRKSGFPAYLEWLSSHQETIH